MKPYVDANDFLILLIDKLKEYKIAPQNEAFKIIHEYNGHDEMLTLVLNGPDCTNKIISIYADVIYLHEIKNITETVKTRLMDQMGTSLKFLSAEQEAAYLIDSVLKI